MADSTMTAAPSAALQAQAAQENLGLEFGPTLTKEQFLEARLLREQAFSFFGEEQPGWERRDNVLDGVGVVMLMRHHGKPVATLRAVPVVGNEDKLQSLLPISIPEELRTPDCVEIGRHGALDVPDNGLGVPYGVAAIILGARLCMSRTRIRHYIATCRVSYAQVYASVGARTVGAPFKVTGTHSTFTVVHGPMDKIAALPASFGRVAGLSTAFPYARYLHLAVLDDEVAAQ